MIFVTVGTQEPFDRLISAMDILTPQLEGIPVIAQTAKSLYSARHIKTVDFVSPSVYNDYFSQAQLIVSHAGMGTIISALQQEKPIIVLPRLAEFREHRNDHQMATALAFEKLKFINAAYNEKELKDKVLELWYGEIKQLHKLGKYASAELISSLQKYAMDLPGIK